MSDARSLLRQQRAARRIQHPHVQYTAPGKLSCTICHEPIKSEALWETHTRSATHRQRLLAAAKGSRPPVDTGSAATNGNSIREGVAQKSKSSTDTLSDQALLAQIIGGAGQKRKHDKDEDGDVEMEDAAEEDAAARAKRSKPSLGSPTVPASLSSLKTASDNGSPAKTDSYPDKDTERSRRTPAGGTPPGLTRRISGTPSHGVELQIPSRPATPSASAASTPKATPVGRSPLIPQEGQMAGSPSTTKPPPRAAFASTTAADATHTAATTAPAAGNDDDDWAAFESEVVHAAPAPPTSRLPLATGYSGDAVIAAAPMTAEQLAAQKEEEERERRRAQADVALEDEKEEATRALETEFEEMEELEARVRKLKEKREAIRRGSVSATITGSLDASSNPSAAEAEAPQIKQPSGDDATKNGEQDKDDEDDDDDDEDDDDWAGFRFRA